MKYLFLLLLSTICSVGISQVVVIDAFSSRNISKFDDDQKEITSTKVNTGFNLQVMDIAGLSKVEIQDLPGHFKDISVYSPTTISGGKTYQFVSAPIIADKIIFRLSKDGNEVMDTLIVKQEGGGGGGGEGGKNGCEEKPDLPDNKSCPPANDFSNKFGEDISLYSDHTIVYVYDFNKDPMKRRFYKITKPKGAASLVVVPANFNRETLLPGDDVQFKIVNVNKFVYNVSIADSIIHYDSEPSALFTRFFLGDSTFLGDLMGSYGSNIKAHSSASDAIKDIQNDLSCFASKYNWLQNKVLSAYDPCEVFACCYSIDYWKLANDLAIIRTKTYGLQASLDEKKKTADKNNGLITSCKKTKQDAKDNEDALKKFSALSKEEQDKRKDEKTTLDNAKKKLDEDMKGCTEDKIKGYQDEVDNVKEGLQHLTAINMVLANLPTEKELKQIIVFLRNLVTQNQVHTLDYISLKGNSVDLQISISSKDSITKFFAIPEYKNAPTHINIPILWRGFVSFSSGSFIAIGSNLQNKTYNWKPVIGVNNTVDSSHFTLVENGYTLAPVGFSALANLQWKSSRSFAIGVSTGVGLTIESSPRLAYLAGGSLFFGDARQFAVTGGIAAMQVNRLTNDFKSAADQQTIYNFRPTLDYYKEIKVGAFLSISYTPFKTSRSR